MSSQIVIVIAAVLGAIGVGLGAFGAHSLNEFLMETGRVETFETAVRYQMFHVLALLAVALLKNYWVNASWLNWSSWLFIIGILIFSGSLYLLIITGQRWLGAITPIGGLALIGGWLTLALAAWQNNS